MPLQIEYSKSQGLRVWDFLFLGPFLILAGAKKGKLLPWQKQTLIVSGVLIILFNGRNFFVNKKLIEEGAMNVIPSDILQQLAVTNAG